MQKIEAIIQPGRLDHIKKGLGKIGLNGMTISEVKGYGRQKGYTEIRRGAEYPVDFIPKIKIEIIVANNLTEEVIKMIIKNSRTGRIGDGKIFIHPIEETIRIRTGEKNIAAL